MRIPKIIGNTTPNPEIKLNQIVKKGVAKGSLISGEGRGWGGDYELGFLAQVSENLKLGGKYGWSDQKQNITYTIPNVLEEVFKENIYRRVYGVRVSNEIPVSGNKYVRAGLEMLQNYQRGKKSGDGLLSLPDVENKRT